MDKGIRNSLFRFLILWVVQVAILRQFVWGWDGQYYLQVHLYPLFILLLPIRTPRALTIILAFALGIAVDWLYDSYGMHASALVFTAFVREWVFSILEPREGYGLKDTPTKASLGDAWFLRYAAIMLAAHLFFYFSVEAFTFVYIGTILQKWIISWIGSLFFVLAAVYIFNPKA